MLNKVMLIGRLGADPQLSYTKTGHPLARFSIATDSTYLNKDGERVQNTEWHRIVLFERMAENASKYLRKGSLVYIEGELRTRKWQDQQGNERYTTEINGRTMRFLDKKGSGEQGYGDNQQEPRGYSQAYGNSGGRTYDGGNAYQGSSYEGQGTAIGGYANSGFDASSPQDQAVSPSESSRDASQIDKIPF